MNKSNNDNIKKEKTQLTKNANRLVEQDLEYISELTEQDLEAVSGGIAPLALGAAAIIIPAVGKFYASGVIQDAVPQSVTNYVENIDPLQLAGGGNGIPS